jgi:hypothetical protein
MSNDHNLIRSNHPDAEISTTDSSNGFEVDKPEKLPQLRIEDLPEDAKGLSPEELAHVPTLTDSIGSEEPAQVPQMQQESVPEAVEMAQELMPQADSWVEVCQMRIANLSDEIHSLNERLDRFEKRIKA